MYLIVIAAVAVVIYMLIKKMDIKITLFLMGIVVMIVSGSVKKSPIEIVRRTAVPMVAGVVFMFVLSIVCFL